MFCIFAIKVLRIIHIISAYPLNPDTFGLQKAPACAGASLSVLHFERKAVVTLVLCGVCLVCSDAYAVKAAVILTAAVMLAVRDRTFYTFICSFGAHDHYLRSDYYGILRDNIISGTELFIRL